MLKNKIRKSISFDPILLKRVAAIASKEKRTLSNLVNLLVEKYLDKK